MAERDRAAVHVGALPESHRVRAAVLDAPGPPEALRIRELPVPVPGPGQVLIKVEAFGLNRSELHTRLGLADGVTFPRVLGIEATGSRSGNRKARRAALITVRVSEPAAIRRGGGP